jgi:hypothetical protein
MESERRRHQVLHRQARGLVYKVFSYFKREADASMPNLDVAKAQDVCVCIKIYVYLRQPPSFVSVSTTDRLITSLPN